MEALFGIVFEVLPRIGLAILSAVIGAIVGALFFASSPGLAVLILILIMIAFFVFLVRMELAGVWYTMFFGIGWVIGMVFATSIARFIVGG